MKGWKMLILTLNSGHSTYIDSVYYHVCILETENESGQPREEGHRPIDHSFVYCYLYIKHLFYIIEHFVFWVDTLTGI